MIKKTKKDLQKEVEDLQFEVNRFKIKKKKKKIIPSQSMWCIQKKITARVGIKKILLI